VNFKTIRTVRCGPLALVLAAQLALANPPADEPVVTAEAGAPEAAPAGGLQQVVVTAQKRKEDVKDVPISISVIGGDDLQAQRITNFDDISRAVAGVSFNAASASEGTTYVVVRGVSSTSGSSTVGIYMDDVSITLKNFYDGASQPRLFDLDRIEVLKGPQGTLWGDSSEGGTIRFVSKQPDMNTFSSEVGLDGSNTDHGSWNHGETAILNVPVQAGVFAIRGSFSYEHDSGYIDHYTLGGQLAQKGVNYENVWMMRLTGKLIVGDGFVVTPAVFLQRDYQNDNNAFYPSFGLWKQNKQVQEYGTDELALPSLTVTKGFGFADFTSVSGVFGRSYERQEDGTFYNSTAFAQFFVDPLYPAQQPQTDALIGTLRSAPFVKTHYLTISQEFRLASPAPEPGDLPLKWVAGVYFSDQWFHNTNYQTIPGIYPAFQSIFGYSLDDPAQSLVWQTYSGCVPMSSACVQHLFPNNIDESDNRYYRERQYAFFGQADYDILPRLHAGLGARYAISAENFRSTEIGFYQIGNISPYYQSARFNAFTPKATLGYDVNSGSTVYTSAAKGFRLGGPTGPIVFGPTSVCNSDFVNIGQTTQPTKFDSDSLWTYELGSKNRLWNNRIALDGATFYTNWKNIQQQIYLPTCGYYFTKNIGDAEIFGGEVQASARVMRGLTVETAATLQHATITSSNAPKTAAVGAHLIDVPYETLRASVAYDRPLQGDMSLTSRADFSWTGHSYGAYNYFNSAAGAPNPNYQNPAYSVLNLSAGITTPRYDVSLYAKNAANNHIIIQRPQINTVSEGYTVRPRTIGLNVKMRM